MLKYLPYLVGFALPVCAQQVSPLINQFPSREFGQPQLLNFLNAISPNLVEGRELWSPASAALDTSSGTPILYVADTSNNRVLAWKNPNNLGVCGTNNPSCGFADLVIGQRDLTGTLQGGPGRPSLNAGFAFPTAVTVDGSGNLYVADTGNNRILRFPAPFQQSGALLSTDLVIGQKTDHSGTSVNQGNQAPSNQTLYLSGFEVTGMAFDSSGGLWVPDPGNNRVLRFPADQLAANTTLPAADIVMGQLDFQTSNERQAPPNTPGGAAFFGGSLRHPSAVAIAPNGAMYIGDGFGRVLYFLPGIPSGSAGVSASRILGLAYNIQGQPQLTPINNYGLNSTVFGLFMLGSNLFVADPGAHRIVKYDIPDNWPPPANLGSGAPVTTQFSPPMIDVIGQNDLQSGKANKGHPEADATTLRAPLGGFFAGTDLWIADSGNNRVISLPQQSGKYPNGTRLVGQLDWPYNSPNLIEGREVNFGTPSGALAGVAIDKNSSPPHLYVADSLNNRILCFNDARKIGRTADLVIGQTDFYRSLINGKTNDPQIPNQSGLFTPSGLIVDGNGNLYVADTGNGRVLRFPPPFAQASGSQLLPNLVLGQASFNSQQFDASISTMQAPVGLALFSDGSLAVSDIALNRVMIFRKKAGADFTNGQSAASVLGQPDPNSSNASNAAAGMNSPRQIAVDTSDRLYVADFGNSRLMVWSDGKDAGTGTTSASQFNGIASTQGIVVSPISGEIWITNSSNNQILRLPEYNTLVLNSTPNQYTITGFIQAQTPAAAVTLDGADNPIVAESANRLTFFYAALTYKNAASYNSQPIAPGMIVTLGRLGKDFSLDTNSAQVLPWPPSLGDVQVTVNGIQAPVYFTGSGIVNLQVPTANMPTSGNVEFEVTRPSTGEILATGQFPMAPYSPGFFTSNALGTGQVAAINVPNQGENFTNFINSPSNPVSRDGNHFIAFFLTGAGVCDGGPDPAPTDGAAPVGVPHTHLQPTVIFNPPGQIIASGDVQSFCGGGYPGLWQVNVKVPFAVPPSANVQVVIQMSDARSNIGPNGGNILTTFATK